MAEIRKLKRTVIKEEFISITGDYQKAIILNQFLYWSERINDFDSFILQENERASRQGEKEQDLNYGWIYKKAEELSEETMLNLSVAAMRNHIKELINLNFISERTNPKYKWDRTKQYRVNLVEIVKALNLKGYDLENYKVKLEVSNNKNAFLFSENGNSKNENRIKKMEKGNSENKIQTYENSKAIPEINTEINTEIKSKNTSENTHIYTQIIDYLNERAGTHYKSTTPQTQKLIKARMNEGFTTDDFMTVIDKKCNDWIGTEYEQYLRPQTLFGNKFENYLNSNFTPKKNQPAKSNNWFLDELKRIEKEEQEQGEEVDDINDLSKNPFL